MNRMIAVVMAALGALALSGCGGGATPVDWRSAGIQSPDILDVDGQGAVTAYATVEGGVEVLRLDSSGTETSRLTADIPGVKESHRLVRAGDHYFVEGLAENTLELFKLDDGLHQHWRYDYNLGLSESDLSQRRWKSIFTNDGAIIVAHVNGENDLEISRIENGAETRSIFYSLEYPGKVYDAGFNGGHLYVLVSDHATPGDRLYIFNNDFSRVGSVSEDGIRDIAALSDGVLYTKAGSVVAIDRFGNRLWQVEISAAEIYEGTNIFILRNGRYFSAIDGSGNELWRNYKVEETFPLFVAGSEDGKTLLTGRNADCDTWISFAVCKTNYRHHLLDYNGKLIRKVTEDTLEITYHEVVIEPPALGDPETTKEGIRSVSMTAITPENGVISAGLHSADGIVITRY
ncbi:MAG: hypothetical protein R3208_10925 [Ketobacteraceae bacterium]|nr:hypothetical protein [Ketobacteraceae bacterium]